jgi:HK97 gp10 family phage protein
MSTPNIRFEVRPVDLSKLYKFLDNTFPNIAKDAADAASHRVADDAVEKAKFFVPVDTGALRKSIRKEARARPAGYYVYIGIRAGGYVRNPKTGRLVDYALYVEYGTSRMSAQPFMRPALRWAAKRFKGYFRVEWDKRRSH